MPTIYVIAGPNGVGKTTFMSRHLERKHCGLEFVNPDLIARDLSPSEPESVSVEAGRVALKRIRELIGARMSGSARRLSVSEWIARTEFPYA